jgi:hypothetical protein
MNNTSSGPPLVKKITDGGAWIPPAEGVTLVTGSPMNDAADWVAENGNTVADLNGFQHLTSARDRAIPPPTFEDASNNAEIEISKVNGDVSLVDAEVQCKVQCLDEVEILGAETPQADTGQEPGSATWKIVTGKCSVIPRQSMLRPRVLTSNKYAPLQGLNVEIMSRKVPVLSVGLMQTDSPLTSANRSVQSAFISKHTTLLATGLQRESMQGVVLGSLQLSTTLCPQSSAHLPASVDPADVGGTTQTAPVLRGNIWKARVLRGNIWKSLGRRLACRPLFAHWVKLSFLYRSSERIPDQHSYYPPTSLIPNFDFSASQAYLKRRWQLLRRLRWSLFCMQFRRMSVWARMLILSYLLRCFQQFYKWRCSQSRDGPNADKTPASFWTSGVLHSYLWLCAAIHVYCLSCLFKQQLIGLVMLIFYFCPSFLSLAQFTVILMGCLSFCVSILQAGSEFRHTYVFAGYFPTFAC